MTLQTKTKNKFHNKKIKDSYSSDHILKIIYWTTILMLIVTGINAIIQHTIYIMDTIVFGLIVTFLFLFRKKIIFSWQGALLCCMGIFMNISGMFGAYNISLYTVGWDKFLHLITSTGLTLLTYTYLQHIQKNNSKPIFNKIELAIITIIIVMGAGALNEIVEFTGARYFGINQGILTTANGNIVANNDFEKYDTQWDLITNTIAAIATVTILTINSNIHKKSDKNQQTKSKKKK